MQTLALVNDTERRAECLPKGIHTARKCHPRQHDLTRPSARICRSRNDSRGYSRTPRPAACFENSLRKLSILQRRLSDSVRIRKGASAVFSGVAAMTPGHLQQATVPQWHCATAVPGQCRRRREARECSCKRTARICLSKEAEVEIERQHHLDCATPCWQLLSGDTKRQVHTQAPYIDSASLLPVRAYKTGTGNCVGADLSLELRPPAAQSRSSAFIIHDADKKEGSQVAATEPRTTDGNQSTVLLYVASA